MKGKELLGSGMLAYDLLTIDRNRHLSDARQRIPLSRFLSREEVISRFPGVDREGLTGAAVFCDGQIYSPQRLALAFLRAAVEQGVEACNYMKAESFLQSGKRVTGVRAHDLLDGSDHEIQAEVVVNAAGPWAEHLLARQNGLQPRSHSTFSRDAFFIVPRRLDSDQALAVSARTKDPDAILSREARHLFLVPWRDCTLVGVWHVVHQGAPDDFRVSDEDLQGFLDEINWAYPALDLKMDEVLMWNAGLVLFGENKPGAENLSYGKRSKIIDHKQQDGIEGLLSLIGIRYTTARGDAKKLVDQVMRKRGQRRACKTAETPVYGGEIPVFDELLNSAQRKYGSRFSDEVLLSLVQNHGAHYQRVLELAEQDSSWSRVLPGTHVLGAEVVYAAREEMALKLEDVVFRRTDLGTAGHPGQEAVRACAEIMARERGWNPQRSEQELAEVEALFRRFRATPEAVPADRRSMGGT
jgi:glycerol-3-phosphate dehydrogenase